MVSQFEDLDAKEVDLPDTVFIRDIESRVFQAIAIKCLATIDGVSLIEGTLIDDLLGREGMERVKGIYIEQDLKNHSVNIKIELNVRYGINLPDKAEEIQTKIVDEITHLTGLHVASVHVVFKNLILDQETKNLLNPKKEKEKVIKKESNLEGIEEYSEEF